MVTTTPPERPESGNSPIRIEDEMRTSYLTYAMSVIVSRALPDVRDGLKPVQRRILYAMHDMGIRPNSAFRKCARIAGEVLGKFHPHGEGSVYDALVRMAQDFSMRYPLIAGQGNFGSIDGDPPAAMRYTEARLAAIADELLADIDQNTVNFAANFDDSLGEPTVLPARMPNMLVNGASGIAVGMATNIPPHNLGEICDAIVRLIDNPDTTTEELMRVVKGPDFPTAGNIHGHQGIYDTYTTGRGRIIMEGTTEIEEVRGGREHIIITELPYQVNKANLVEKIATLTREKKLEGISDIRDESDRHGMRVVIELRRDAQAYVVLNNLFRHTALRSSFNTIMLALVDGQPQVLPLKRCLTLFIEHRREVIRRRSEFQLAKAQDRDHVVQGLLLALDRMDEVIAIIRGSADVEEARNNLMSTLDLSEIQAQAILDMQLRRLAALERERLETEHEDLLKRIAELEALLASPALVLAEIKTETQTLKKSFSNPRRTVIHDAELADLTDESFIPHEDAIITLSQKGYVKRVPSDTFRTQHRGGKGVVGMRTREDDAVMDLVVVDTHDTLFFFTNRGRVYPLKAFQIHGDSSRTSRGTLLSTLLPLDRGEQIQTMLLIKNPRDEYPLLLATKMGEIKALKTGELTRIRPSGLIVMDLEQGDELVSVAQVGDAKDVVMVTENGQAIKFPITGLTPRSRTAGGVRGIRLLAKDHVVAMSPVTPSSHLLIVSQRGYGKSTPLVSYPRHSRGGQGVRTFRTTDKAGKVAAARVVSEGPGQLILIISEKAQVVRITLEDVRVTGRNTQGVIVWRDREADDQVASIACFQESDTQLNSAEEGDGKTGAKASAAKAPAAKATEPEAAVEPELNEDEDAVDEMVDEDSDDIVENNEDFDGDDDETE
ncbi:MAG: DNA gyrase subunit A [Chloroflexi bacterium]|nr:DNA gyrase subunit A [Chloroflexota bacterium]MDA1271082.1 DNA gyrase subunit A [Chloroflexota bacterium]PKB58586.1 MAG: DNA gyrase subunit A [SAR202 cluster bacterium Casp-Chloro-G2]